MRLTATIFSKPSTPARLALNTSAMPPIATRSISWYGPKWSSRQDISRAGGKGAMSAAGSLGSCWIASSATDARSTPGPSGSFGSVTISLALVLTAAGGSRASSSSNTGGAGRNTTAFGSVPRRLKAFSTSASVPPEAGSGVSPGTAKGDGETGIAHLDPNRPWPRAEAALIRGQGRVHEIAEQVLGAQQTVAFLAHGPGRHGWCPGLVSSASAHSASPRVRPRKHKSTTTVRSKKTSDLPRCEPAGYHAPRCIIRASHCGRSACLEGDRDGMDFLIGLLGGSTLPWVLGVAAAFVGYKFLSERVRIQAPGGMNREDLISRLLGPGYAKKKVEREVHRLKKQANYLGAGKLLEENGRLAEAAEAYLEGQETWAAAATLEKMGRAEKAAELFLQAGDFKKAAALFTQAGKPARAAALFLEKGNNLEAARLYAQANQWGTAADLYAKSGYPIRAAESWEKDGKPLKAAEAYEKHFTENVTLSTSFSQSAGTADAKSALQAGRAYEQANQVDKAASIYSRGGFHRQAAEAFLKLGQPAKAAELFLRAEDNEKAAIAFEQAGDSVRAATLRGEQAFKSDQLAEAAAWFVKGHDFLRAAELYESVGMMPEAAGAYEAGDSWAAAGGVYIRAGLKDKAAAAYEKAGESETAARLYQELGDASKASDLYARAGDSFKSGEAAARAGEREKAIAFLQRVLPSDENHRAATELLARLFIETSRPGLAMERLRKAIGSEPISAANLDFHYWLALAHEAAGAPGEALALYKKIQSEDLQFRDVAKRVARLAAAGPAAAPAFGRRHHLRPLVLSRRRPSAGATPSPRRGRAVRRAAPAALRPQGRDRARSARRDLPWRGRDRRPQRGDAHAEPGAAHGAAVVHAVAAELKAASQLSHPNLVKVIALMEWEGAALRGDRVRGRPHLRRGARERAQARLRAGALARPRDRPGADPTALEGPRPRVDPALERHGRRGCHQARRSRPRPARARRRPEAGVPRARGRPEPGRRPVRAQRRDVPHADRDPPAVAGAGRRAADAFDARAGRPRGDGQAAAARPASAARAAARERRGPAAGAAGDGQDRLSA